MSPPSKLAERLPVLNDYIRRTGRAPTLDELRTLFNIRSKNTASVLAKRFVAAGALARTASGRSGSAMAIRW